MSCYTASNMSCYTASNISCYTATNKWDKKAAPLPHLLEKLIVTQLLKKFTEFYGLGMLIAVFT